MRSFHAQQLVLRTMATSIVLALLVALAPRAAFAADVRTEEASVIDAAMVIDDDLYVFGDSVEIRGTINGDVVSAARQITISGTVNGDVTAAASTVEISGRVDGAVRASGGNVVLSGPVRDDVLIGAGTVQIGQGARIGRDLLIGGGTTVLDGTIGRDARVAGGDLTVGGRVGGDLRADVGRARLGDAAMVGGDLVYSAEQAASIAPGATIRGQTRRLASPEAAEPTPGERAISMLTGWLRTLVALLLVGLALVLVFPAFSRRAANSLGTAPWASVGVGLALFVGVPLLAVAIVIAGIFVGGWWLAPMLLGLYAAALVLGLAVAGLFVGRTILLQIGRGAQHQVAGLVVGLAILSLIGLVPVLGWVIGTVAALAGLGAIGRALWLTQHQGRAAATA